MLNSRTVHVLDDEPDVRRSLGQLLCAAGFEVVLYATAAELLEKARSLAPGCLLLDVRMPRVDGLEVQRCLDEAGVWLPVVVMTGQADVPTAVRAMKAGAVDFIEKPFDEAQLIAVVKSTLVLVSRGPRDRAAAEAAQRIATLTRREREVLESLVSGRPNKAIAQALGLSVRTVEAHRARMLTRLGTRTLAEAIRLAVVAGSQRS